MFTEEIFEKLRALNEEVFTTDKEGIEDLDEFEKNDEESTEVEVIDAEAENEDELKDSYVGQVILDCCVCHSKIFRDKHKITLDETRTLADVGEECPYCYATDGYKIIGVVSDFNPEAEETEEEIEIRKKEEMKEALEEKKRALKESSDRVLNAVAEYFKYQDDDLIRLVADGLESVDFADEDDVDSAIDNMMMYNEDIVKIMLHYTNPELDEQTVDEFSEDVRAIARELAESKEDDDALDESWEQKTFKTDEERKKWKEANKDKYQIDDIFVNNGYGVEYRPLKKVNLEKCGEKKGLRESYEEVDEIEDITTGELFRVFGGGFNTRDALVTVEDAEGKRKRIDIGDVINGYRWHKDGEVIHEPVLEESKKELKEAPMYDLVPTDGRASFYGKAKVIKDDDSKDEKLYSYNTLVAELKDGKPIVYDTYSATTLRHIKAWLTQHGFKADSAKQIMQDYGALNEANLTVAQRHNRELDRVFKSKERQDAKFAKFLKDHGYTDEQIEKLRADDKLSDEIADKFVKEGEKPSDVLGSILKEDLGEDVAKYQRWVDYDMKRYGRISDKTMEEVTKAGLSVVKDQYGEYEVIAHAPIEEDLEKVEVETKDEKIEVKQEGEKVVVEAEKKEEETIKPMDDEVKAEIAIDAAKAEDDDFVDIDIDEFDEETFDKLGESYLKRVYNNIDSYHTTNASTSGKTITLEGVIKFKSGNEKKTGFVFEAVNVNRKGKIGFRGENCQITPNRKAFLMRGGVDGGKKFVAESLNYNYRVATKNGSQRMYGTVRSGK